MVKNAFSHSLSRLNSRLNCLLTAPAKKAGFTLASLSLLTLATQAKAIQFDFLDGDLIGSVDTTVTYGAIIRTTAPDSDVNDDGVIDMEADDGNAEFDTGLVSNALRFTSDIELNYKGWSVFLRATAFYDREIQERTVTQRPFGQPRTTPGRRIPKSSRKQAGANIFLLDSYLAYDYDFENVPLLGTLPVSLRFGRQVMNWGEALQFRGGIGTSSNPVDGAAANVPGSSTKEALLPLQMLSFQAFLTDRVTLDAYTVLQFSPSEPNPTGTFRSTNDNLARGAFREITDVRPILAAANFPDPIFQLFRGPNGGASLAELNGIAAGLRAQGASEAEILAAQNAANPFPQDIGILRTFTKQRSDNAPGNGQFGIRLTYLADILGGTEFGFYFINQHNTAPQAIITAGEANGCADLNPLFAGGSVDFNASNVRDVNQFICDTGRGALQAGLGGAQAAGAALQAAIAAGDAAAIGAAQAQLDAANTGIANGVGIVSSANALHLVDTTRSRLVYNDDIRLFGLSFNTTVGDTSISGELAYRPNDSLTFGDPVSSIVDIGGAALGGIGLVGAGLPGVAGIADGGNFIAAGPAGIVGSQILDTGQAFQANTQLTGRRRKETYNGVLVFVNSLTERAPLIGADDLVTVVELGATYIPGKLDGLATRSSALGIDHFSWGYRLVVSATYNNVFGFTLNPVINFANDVTGDSNTLGRFAEGNKNLGVSLSATYNTNFRASLAYNSFFQKSRLDEINRNDDRDNITFSLSYSF